MLTRITVRGAREHNLKGVDVDIPRDTSTVITGLSGSGLTSNITYAEGAPLRGTALRPAREATQA